MGFDMRNKFFRTWDHSLILGLICTVYLIIGFYIFIGSFSRLLGDDYCSIYFGRRLGLFRSIWFWYITWHGGFSASAVDWFLSFVGPRLIPFATFISLALWLLVAIYAWRLAFFNGRYSPVGFFKPFLLGSLMIFITLVVSPEISQSVFWWGGARAYIPPLVVVTLYLIAYKIFVSSVWDIWQLIVWYLTSFGLIFLGGGFAEVFTPVQLVIFVFVIFGKWMEGKLNFRDKSIHFILAGMIGAFLSLVVMVLAPGNALRQEFFPTPPNVWTILTISMKGYMSFLESIFSSKAMTLGLIGSMLAAIWTGTTSYREIDNDDITRKLIRAFTFLLLGFVFAFGCFPSSAYGLSDFPPPRTQIIPVYLLVAGFLVSGFMLGQWLGVQQKNIEMVRAGLLGFACLFIIVSAWDEFRFLSSIYPDHVAFAQKWDWVDQNIKDTRNSGANEVFIPAMKNWAFLEYPTDNPKYWPNVCYSSYYDIKVFAPPFGE